MKQWFSKLIPHWRFIAFEICLLLGGLLILPAFRLIPLILNSVWVSPNETAQSGRMDEEPGLASKTLTPSFKQFMPFFNQDEGDDKKGEGENHPVPFFTSIDFSPDAEQVTFTIFPDDEVFNSGQPVDVSFIPGERCTFGDGRACIYPFSSNSGRRVIFASVHSGLGAEAEKFRDLIEGTGFNQALFDEDQVVERTQALAGAGIRISQGESQIDSLILSTVVRIPPEKMSAYMQTPVEAILEYAIGIGVLNTDILSQDLLLFETCGWRLPGEAPVPGVPHTSNSVYLGVIVSPEP